MITREPSFPLDVLEVILDALALEASGSSYAGLKACAQTCHALHRPCNKRIYRKICLCRQTIPGIDAVRLTLVPFARIVLQAPEIADYVRELYLIPDWREAFLDYEDSELIAVALAKITKLTTFSFKAHFNWDEILESRFAPPLLQFFSLPTLTRLEIEGTARVPLRTILQSNSLRTLKLDWVDLVNDDGDDDQLVLAESLTPPLRLEEFIVSRTSSLEEANCTGRSPAIDFRFLRTLCFGRLRSPQDFDISSARYILEQTQHLQHLRISCDTEGFVISDYELATMVHRNITTLLAFEINIDYQSWSDDALKGLDKLLEVLGSGERGRSVLETFTATISVATFCSADSLPWAEWGIIGELLSQRESWPALRTVNLKVTIARSAIEPSPSTKSLEPTINVLSERHFPGLSKKADMDFQLSILHA